MNQILLFSQSEIGVDFLKKVMGFFKLAKKEEDEGLKQEKDPYVNKTKEGQTSGVL